MVKERGYGERRKGAKRVMFKISLGGGLRKVHIVSFPSFPLLFGLFGHSHSSGVFSLPKFSCRTGSDTCLYPMKSVYKAALSENIWHSALPIYLFF